MHHACWMASPAQPPGKPARPPAHLAAQQVSRLLAHRAGVAPAALAHLQHEGQGGGPAAVVMAAKEALKGSAGRGIPPTCRRQHVHTGTPASQLPRHHCGQQRRAPQPRSSATHLLLRGHSVHRAGATGGREWLLAQGLEDDAHAICGKGGSIVRGKMSRAVNVPLPLLCLWPAPQPGCCPTTLQQAVQRQLWRACPLRISTCLPSPHTFGTGLAGADHEGAGGGAARLLLPGSAQALQPLPLLLILCVG